MNEFKDILSKVKNQVSTIADVTERKGKEVYETSISGVKIFDLKSQIEGIYKEIGRLVYESHNGIEVSESTIKFKIAEIDRKKEQIEALKNKSEQMKTMVVCTNCNRAFAKEDKCCPECGLTY